MSAATDLGALDDDALRAVRDDRSATVDSVYRLLEQPLAAVDLRLAVFDLVSKLSLDAINEALRRLSTSTTTKGTDQ